MPSFASPLWLLGLAALPVIWWLHRLQRPEHAVEVSALFLWQDSTPAPAPGYIPLRSDPRWLLRAVLFSIVLLALADPRLQGMQPLPLSVWFDDSLSMQTLENGVTRTTLAIDSLITALQQRHAEGAVVVRSLGDPAAAIDLPVARPGEWRRLLTDWSGARTPGTLRLPAELPSEKESWVVTDGSDPDVNAWLALAPVSRVIVVGKTGDNVALARLAVRRSLDPSGQLLGMLTLRNNGENAVERRLEIMADGELISAAGVVLEPGIAVPRNFSLPPAQRTVSAHLSPADALKADDGLTLALDKFDRVAVHVRGYCGSGLHAALAAHPGLDVQTQAAPGDPGVNELVVDCSGTGIAPDGPALVIHPATAYLPVTEAVHWHASAGRLQQLWLDAGWLAVNHPAVIAGEHIPLLSAGSTPLVLADTLPGRVDVYIDLKSPSLIHRPEYPVLISGLVELALGRRLLDPVAAVWHDPRESNIRPVLEWHAADAVRPSGLIAGDIELAPHLIAVAVLLLLADIFMLPRRRAESLETA